MTEAVPIRLHAKLSASAAKKWVSCTMAPAMEEGLPDEVTDDNREGTCAHAVGEARVRFWLATGGHDMSPEREAHLGIADYDEFFNEEFDEYVDEYVNFVVQKVEELRELHGEKNVTVLCEQRLNFSRWVPEGFGTGDIVIIVPGKIIVIDLKFGQGIWVDGEDNWQLKLYGLGAWATYDILYEFDEVEVWIHQPRKHNVSGETIDVHAISGLLTWADEIIVPRAAIAYAALNGDRSVARFHPGKHCYEGFCKARFTCAARARFELEAGDLPFAGHLPETLTVEQLESVIDRADGLAKWVKDVKGYLLMMADAGKVTLSLFKLAIGRSNRKIVDVDRAAGLLMTEGFKSEDIYEAPKLKGLGKLERLVGAKNLTKLLGDVLQKPQGRTTLVPASSKSESVDPKRTSPEQDFA